MRPTSLRHAWRWAMVLYLAAAFTVQPGAVVSQSLVPLPDNVKITKPGSEVPPAQAAFSGRWFGVWSENDKRYGSREHILIVERIRIDPSRVNVVYAWGPRPALSAIPERAMSTGPGHTRIQGAFVEDELHLHRSDGAFIRYRMLPNETLDASWELTRFKTTAVLRRM